MSKSSIMIILLLLAALVVAVSSVYASLSPMSFGFPVLIQNSTTTALNQANVTAFSLNNANVDFPYYSSSTGTGSSGSAFPMMTESAVDGQTAVTSHFLQNSQFSSFSYPVAGIGVDGISGFWL